ncbi:MAG TPA: cytochrome b/b6 domain-containing protein [Polyangiaceae bacterium]|jgi:formate dehydrogenase gamma subunit|nr:MAG: Tetrathionate reductase subunit B precursor [Deltaproteobacteria bacterium ADurb.Bin207]HNS96040.1 cytochrome b/b6 domain-containing protein [Polyangiaceae bacterium]HNZ22359.1 cytochrome b/b6 domain-containing protein [Polyangiaceae bacterium]HOD20893.1 cytochrome b/b6 domain-containing protein [Polyangiaceae bacterium]HOE49069.1 cytochrome b/b6 domain-containing protein [Polyangiaceae bacterium]
MRYGMMIELDKCVGCLACVSACKERWDSGPGVARDWVATFEHGSREKNNLGVTFYPGLCMQCEDHPCTLDCPTGATYADENGVVIVDPEICIGCGNCVTMCPYGARTPDPSKGIVEKCNLCAPYVANGGQPACVTTCLAECRHFGDLDDPNGSLMQLIQKRGAKTLTTPQVDVGPKVYYAPESHRQQILAQGVIREPTPTWLTKVWQGVTRPVAQLGVPAFAVIAGAGGLLMNLRHRGENKQPQSQVESEATGTLPRHRFGMRFLHWFNALSWVLLLLTGTALMAAPSFALFGVGFPKAISTVFGGTSNLILFHVLWGLLWTAVIIPPFLFFKRGGIEALREVMLTRDDIRWFMLKPLVMLGIGNHQLPPQDKYNAGQKVFAVSALVGTATIIGTGLVMTFHLGSSHVVAAAILVHKLAVGLALVGVAVHITMAAIMKEERPALMSMIKGDIDRRHAEHHSSKWVEELAHESAAESSVEPVGEKKS